MAGDIPPWWCNSLGPLPGPDNPDWVRQVRVETAAETPPTREWFDHQITRTRLRISGSLGHLWDNVALFVAVALLDYWGVAALAWPNDDDHTLGWLADAP